MAGPRLTEVRLPGGGAGRPCPLGHRRGAYYLLRIVSLPLLHVTTLINIYTNHDTQPGVSVSLGTNSASMRHMCELGFETPGDKVYTKNRLGSLSSQFLAAKTAEHAFCLVLPAPSVWSCLHLR